MHVTLRKKSHASSNFTSIANRLPSFFIFRSQIIHHYMHIIFQHSRVLDLAHIVNCTLVQVTKIELPVTSIRNAPYNFSHYFEQ